MPYLPKKPCAFPQCKNLTRERYCYEHKKKADREYDLQRLSAYKRGYNTHWNRLRRMFLNEHPLCFSCRQRGFLTPATEVHHIKPLADGGDNADENLMALCKSCHSTITGKARYGSNKETKRIN